MPEITVSLPHHSYQIGISEGNISQLGDRLKQLELGTKVLIVSNSEIFELYGQTCIESLEDSGFEVYHHLIPVGESSKNLQSIEKIYDSALTHHLERSSTMVALGGGVIGDMTGFTAATWLRGINFVQVPTSFLAMVDASVGGKTGVNHPQGKNLIGAFYQPQLVLIDPNVLKTLPDREFRAGMAEVIKYGVIWDPELFSQLENAANIDSFEEIDPQLLKTILIRSCQAKADVVAQDEKETGIRAILNYGHTIGHAIESLTEYNQYVHGEAIALGMIAAGEIAIQMGLWRETDDNRQNKLISKVGLPTKINVPLKVKEVLEALKNDKKVKSGKIRFVLPTKIGSVKITDKISSEVVKESIMQLLSKR